MEALTGNLKNNQPRTHDTLGQERALLVGVLLPDSRRDVQDPLGELRSLAQTAGALVVDEMIARRQKLTPALYVGSGKAQEIADRARQNDVDAVIFDNDLSPAQVRDLEEVVGRKVLDRSEVILDIFAAHARTTEARLQVELAQLEYTYPRLRHMWSHLERIAGGATGAAASVGGIGTRGPGEKQIEIDRRLVQKRVSELKKRIAVVDRRKQRLVASREEHFLACLVGYTNAGKSTLMNLLTGAGAYVADKLFATLDTKTRRWNLGGGQHVLLSDTVGFVRNLPHHLVASFRATLEEAIGANLLLHVADASHPQAREQIEAVDGVLAELGLKDKDRLLVLNKVDRLADPAQRTILTGRYPQAIFVSAATGENAQLLIEVVGERARRLQAEVTLEASAANGRLMHYLAQHARMRQVEYKGDWMRFKANLNPRHLEGLKQFGDDVRVVDEERSES